MTQMIVLTIKNLSSLSNLVDENQGRPIEDKGEKALEWLQGLQLVPMDMEVMGPS